MLLIHKDLCVCELTFILNMEQSRISRHLRILKDADLVDDIRDGKWIIYKISKQTKKDLETIFENIIGDDLSQFREIKTDLKNLHTALEKNIKGCPIRLERRET